MYKGLLLDFFGVFCPDLSFEWFKKTVPDYELHIAKLQDICDRSDRGELSMLQFHQEVSKLTGVPLEDVVSGIADQMVLNEALVTFIRSIKSNFRLAIVSNSANEWVDKILNEYKLTDIFDAVIVSADVGFIKPDKGIFDLSASRIGLTLSECIFIDDREFNVDKATSYGIKSLVFTTNEKLMSELNDLGLSSRR